MQIGAASCPGGLVPTRSGRPDSAPKGHGQEETPPGHGRAAEWVARDKASGARQHPARTRAMTCMNKKERPTMDLRLPIEAVRAGTASNQVALGPLNALVAYPDGGLEGAFNPRTLPGRGLIPTEDGSHRRPS